MLFTLFAFALALGLLITFHELGHYWVARRFGVRILRFSIGFGPVLVQRTDRHGTQWALSAIPLGGYVKMQDEAVPHGSDAERLEAFNEKPLWQRSSIVLAGPLANLILAALLYAGLGLVGTQEPAAILATPPAASPAAQAGLQGGQTIIAVDHKPVASWSEFRWRLLDTVANGGEHVLSTQQGASKQDHVLQLERMSDLAPENDPLAQVGLSLSPGRPVVTQLMAGGAAQEAGLQPGDVIVGIDEVRDPTAALLIEYVSARPGSECLLFIERDGSQLRLPIVPRAESTPEGRELGRIGVLIGSDLPMVAVRYGVFEGVWLGVRRTADTAWFSLKMMARMVTGQASLRNISGPVTIADYAGQTARAGWVSYVSFLALISVSLGVLNLLPIPMLDGGHLVYYAYEALRGRPASEEWLMRGQRLGLALLAALMGLAFMNDFLRLFT